MCHILHHEDQHVGPIWPTDTYFNNSIPPLPPLSLSSHRKGLKGIDGGLGLWNMLTPANKKKGTER